MTKLIILALDGFSWNIIKDLIKMKKINNINTIINNSSCGILYADEPLLSPQIWTSITTGKKQEKHGIKDFYSTKYDLKTDQIWDILIDHNFRIGIYKYITALGLRKKDYFFIPSPHSFEKDVYPKDLIFIQELSKKARMTQLNMIFLIKMVKFLLKNRFPLKFFILLIKEVLLMKFNRQFNYRFYKLKHIEFLINSNFYFNLLKFYNPDFTIFYENIIDTLSHLFWKDYKNKTGFYSLLQESYLRVANFIGKINNYASKNNYHLLIISDHGFKVAPEIKPQDTVKKVNILNLLKELNLDNDVYGTLLGLNILVRLKPKSIITFKELKEIFEKITCNNKKVFIINEFEEVLIIKLKYFIGNQKNLKFKIHTGKTISIDSIISFNSRITGYHDAENGFFLIKGPNIEIGKHLGKIKPYDIVPTILSLFGIPIPKDIDGVILKELFKKETKVEYSDKKKKLYKEEIALTKEEEEIIKERLKALGYL